MKIAVACDHRGYAAKKRLAGALEAMGHQVEDFGAHNEQSSDYPDAGYEAAKAVRDGRCERGILFCGSGVGMCITANKVRGIRGALCHDEMTAELARHHNDSNVLCISADLVGEALIRRIVEVWLAASFDGGRHARRVDKIRQIERDECGPQPAQA
jgi:ribose 5-phosphate isomerase B